MTAPDLDALIAAAERFAPFPDAIIVSDLRSGLLLNRAQLIALCKVAQAAQAWANATKGDTGSPHYELPIVDALASLDAALAGRRE